MTIRDADASDLASILDIYNDAIEHDVDAARSRDLHTIVAGIATENEISLHLHKRLGFREVGHLFEVGYKFGRWLDLTLLQLSLHRGEHHVV